MILYDRQLGLFDPNKPEYQVPIVVVGAGTIGSWTVLALAKMGLRRIEVIDYDFLELQNIPNQFYRANVLEGMLKVYELSGLVEMVTGVGIIANALTFKQAVESLDGIYTDSIIISTVDNMATRKEIYERLQVFGYHHKLFIDARVGGNSAKLYSVIPGTLAFDDFSNTLHSDDLSTIQNAEARALSDVPCTARSIVDVSMVVAGTICNLVRKFIITGKVPNETIIDMTNGMSMLSYPQD